MPGPDNKHISRAALMRVLRLTLIGLAYFAAARTGLLFVLYPEGVAGIWWAGGVALAALLLSKRGEWLAILGIIFVVNALTNLFAGNNLAVSAGFALANALEPWLAAWIMTRSPRIRSMALPRWNFSRLIELHWLGVGSALACALAGMLGALVIALGFGTPYAVALRIWWVEDLLGMLLVTPLILSWISHERKDRSARKDRTAVLLWWLEMLLVLGALLAAAWSIFGDNHHLNQLLQEPYILFPLLLWAALRLGPRGVTLAIFGLTWIVLGCTTAKIGSYPLGGFTHTERLVYAQLFISIVTISNMALAAVLGERKHAEETLRASESRYRAIVHTNRDGFFMADWDGNILEVNDAYCQMTGYRREELMGMNIRQLDSQLTDERMAALARDALSKGTIFFETRHLRKRGSPFEVEVSANYLHIDGGRFFTFVRDITQRKQNERDLNESQARWQLAVEGTGDGLWDWNPSTGQVFFSKQWKAMLGYAEEEITNSIEEWRSRLHPDDVAQITASIEKHFRGEASIYIQEQRVRCKDGQYRWILTRGKVIEWAEDGQPLRMIGSNSDIHELRTLSERSRRNEQVLGLFVTHTPAAIAIFDNQMRYLAHSQRYLEDYRLPEQSLIGRSHYEIFPEIPERWREIHQRVLAGANERCDEDPFPRADGSLDWVRWEMLPWPEADGSIGGALLFSEVITDGKLARDKLRQSELNLQKSQEVAHIGSWTWDTVTGQVIYTDEMYRIFGIDPRTFSGDIADAIHQAVHPDDLLLVEQANARVIHEQQTGSLEYRVVWPDGSVRWVWATPGEAITNEYGHILKLTGIVQDITERRLAEEQLRASEERFRGLFEYSPISIWEEDFSALMAEIRRLRSEGVEDFRSYLQINPRVLLDLASQVRILDVNQMTARLFNFEHKEDAIRFLPSYFTEESMSIFREEVVAFAEGQTTFQAEIPVQGPDGRRKVLAMSLLVAPGCEQTYSRVLASFIDVTGLRMAEEELERFFNFVPDMICIATIDAHFKKLNPEWGRVLGYREEELLARPFLDLVHPDDKESTIGAIQQQARGEAVFHFTNRYRTKKGDYRWLEWNASAVWDRGLVFGAARDITEHIEAEEEIRQHTQNLETIRRILSSLPLQMEQGAVLNRVVQGALDLTGMQSGGLFMMDGQQNLLLSAQQNIPATLLAAYQQAPERFAESILGGTARMAAQGVRWQAPAAHADCDWMQESGVQVFAALPLQIQRRCIGVLCMFACDDRQPTQHSLDLLQDLCGPFALAIENAQLYEQTRRDAARAEALARTAARLNTSLDLKAVDESVCEEAALALNVPAVRLLAMDEQNRVLRMVAGYGLPARYQEKFENIPLEQYDQLPGKIGPITQILDLWEHPETLNAALHRECGMRSVMTVSVAREDHLVGALSVFSLGEKRVFRADEVALLQGLADQAAQAIENARLFQQVSDGRKHLRELSKQLVEVQEAERRTLALELHDELGQMLNSIKMSLDMMPMLSPEAAHEHLLRAQALVSDLVARVRRMSLELRPSMLDDMGLLPALRWLFKNFHAQTGESVAFEASNIDQRFAPQIEITAYRITQEALTNVIRHADNKQVHVEAWADEQAFNLQITDHGQGFDYRRIARQHASSGLSGMRERARLIGGELAVESEIGVGTTLTARLPFQANG